MGLSQKDTYKSNANMHNGHPSTGSTFKWSQTLLPQTSQHVSQAQAGRRIWLLLSFLGRKTGIKLQFDKPSPQIFILSFLQSVQVVQQHTPITNATENMHNMVAHSNTIKWCVVWHLSQHLSPSLVLLLQRICPLHGRKHAHGFPFPELCFENRSFILTVNSQDDRYSPTIPSLLKPCLWRISDVAVARVSPRWSVTRHHRHTHEECRITKVGRAT